jgi:type IV pilus assembly protein PilM
MPRNITTLYISDTSIRLMVTRGKRVCKIADVPLDTSLMDGDAETRQTELVEKIRYLIKTNKIRTSRAIVGLSGLHCISRPAVLPQLPDAMLEEAFLREAKRVFPIPPEQLYISWQVTSISEGNMKAFLVAVPRHIADSLLDALNQVGLKPYLMDVKPLALARLVREPTAIIIDVQPREFDIVIMAEGIPQPIRTVPFPHETLTLSEKMVIVKDELKRTVEFYNSNNADNQIPHDAVIYVSGELADNTELYQALAQETGFRASPLVSPLKSLKQLDPSNYLVNVGLALKELPKEAGALLPNINVLPIPYQPKQISLNKLMAVPVAAAAVGLIIVLGVTIHSAGGNINTLQNEIETTNHIIEKKQSLRTELSSSIESMTSQISQIESQRDLYAAAFDSINEAGEKLNADLVSTQDNLVDDLYLSSISHAGALTLTGSAETEEEVFTYVRNLDATGRFAEITITNLSRQESTENVTDSSMSFFLSLRLNNL